MVMRFHRPVQNINIQPLRKVTWNFISAFSYKVCFSMIKSIWSCDCFFGFGVKIPTKFEHSAMKLSLWPFFKKKKYACRRSFRTWFNKSTQRLGIKWSIICQLFIVEEQKKVIYRVCKTIFMTIAFIFAISSQCVTEYVNVYLDMGLA